MEIFKHWPKFFPDNHADFPPYNHEPTSEGIDLQLRDLGLISQAYGACGYECGLKSRICDLNICSGVNNKGEISLKIGSALDIEKIDKKKHPCQVEVPQEFRERYPAPPKQGIMSRCGTIFSRLGRRGASPAKSLGA